MKKSEFTSFIKEEIINILSEDNHDEKSILAKAKAQAELNKELEKTKDLVGEDEEDDKDAVKAAMKARGKFKKLDLALKSLKDITREMQKLAKDYSKAEGEDKEKIKNVLRDKTKVKNELKDLVDKLEKNVV